MPGAEPAVASDRRAATSPFDARWHVREELGRVLRLLHARLETHRSRGRSPLGDAVHGLVIEDGEAEGLVAQLSQRLAGRGRSRELRSAPDPQSNLRARLAGLGHGNLPLLRAGARFDLTAAEYDALILALGVEWDARFGRLVAYLNDHVTQTRPTVGLALSLSAGDEWDSVPTAIGLLERPCIRDGLLLVEGEGPVPGRSFRLADSVAARLLGEPNGGSEQVRLTPVAPGLLQRLVLTEATRSALTNWCVELRRRRAGPALLIAGPPGTGRHTVARACAAEIGRALVLVNLTTDGRAELVREGRREARWHEAGLCVGVDGVDQLGGLWEELAGLTGPLLVVGDSVRIERLLEDEGPALAVVTLEEPDLAARAALWRRLQPVGESVTEADLDGLAVRFRFGPTRIARSIARAGARAALAPPGERRLSPALLGAACREVGAAAMSRLAEPVPLPYRLHDLVITDEARRELELAIAWIAHGRTVLDAWGFGERLGSGRGLTALVTGPPGVGKTMFAQVLAREIDVELYRVDLSRVLSKWIGETERALGQLFDETAASGCALLFDEADALFGKRSEVKDAHDRYANVEVGYLLQRMEQGDTVCLCASNRPADLDEAFLRRFHINLQLALPGESDRLRIWGGIFPAAARLDEDLDLGQVAKAFELSGGEIRNAALAAAYLAAAEGCAIGRRQVWQAAMREMRKAGRVVAQLA